MYNKFIKVGYVGQASGIQGANGAWSSGGVGCLGGGGSCHPPDQPGWGNILFVHWKILSWTFGRKTFITWYSIVFYQEASSSDLDGKEGGSANIQLDNYCKSRLQRLRLSSKFCPLLIFDEEKKDKCLLFWIFSLVEKQVFNICFHSADTQFGWILWISEGAEELSVIVLDLVSSMSSVGCRPNHIGQNTSTLPKCHIHTNRVI